MTDHLRQLCRLNGTSGREEQVRAYILSHLEGKADVTVDPLGNVLAFVRGKERAKKTVMLSAHMDEVGFIITYITEEGYLKFSPVGGIDDKVIVGRPVSVGDRAVPGVIGIKAIHLTDKADSGKVPEAGILYIDIGAEDRAQALSVAAVGDAAYFVSDYRELGQHKVQSKALDDRFGCALLLDLIDRGVPRDAWFCFLTQEEIGLRGAVVAAHRVNPDYAIVLEATTAADVAGVDDADCVCKQGGGAVVSFMDRRTVYDRTLFRESRCRPARYQMPDQNGRGRRQRRRIHPSGKRRRAHDCRFAPMPLHPQRHERRGRQRHGGLPFVDRSAFALLCR